MSAHMADELERDLIVITHIGGRVDPVRMKAPKSAADVLEEVWKEGWGIGTLKGGTVNYRGKDELLHGFYVFKPAADYQTTSSIEASLWPLPSIPAQAPPIVPIDGSAAGGVSRANRKQRLAQREKRALQNPTPPPILDTALSLNHVPDLTLTHLDRPMDPKPIPPHSSPIPTSSSPPQTPPPPVPTSASNSTIDLPLSTNIVPSPSSFINLAGPSPAAYAPPPASLSIFPYGAIPPSTNWPRPGFPLQMGANECAPTPPQTTSSLQKLNPINGQRKPLPGKGKSNSPVVPQGKGKGDLFEPYGDSSQSLHKQAKQAMEAQAMLNGWSDFQTFKGGLCYFCNKRKFMKGERSHVWLHLLTCASFPKGPNEKIAEDALRAWKSWKKQQRDKRK